MADPVLIQIDDVERPATAKEKAQIELIRETPGPSEA
jgi:hypothetical protein